MLLLDARIKGRRIRLDDKPFLMIEQEFCFYNGKPATTTCSNFRLPQDCGTC